MSEPYINEIESIEAELKRLSVSVKELKAQKKTAYNNLYEYMVSTGADKCGKITLKKVTPKTPVKRKAAKEKKEDGIQLLREWGVDDPEKMYTDFLKSQKN